MATLDEVRAEFQAARDTAGPILEGLRDFSRLNLQGGTAAGVQVAISDYERRIARLDSALSALDTLAGDGYPDLPAYDVLADAYQDLRAQTQTLAAALGQFHAVEEAETAEIVPGEPEPKP